MHRDQMASGEDRAYRNRQIAGTFHQALLRSPVETIAVDHWEPLASPAAQNRERVHSLYAEAPSRPRDQDAHSRYSIPIPMIEPDPLCYQIEPGNLEKRRDLLDKLAREQ